MRYIHLGLFFLSCEEHPFRCRNQKPTEARGEIKKKKKRKATRVSETEASLQRTPARGTCDGGLTAWLGFERMEAAGWPPTSPVTVAGSRP